MRAENAWRIAREAAAEFCAGYIGGPTVPHYDERAKVADDMCEALSFAFRALPMPPAFAEAWRAETEELRGMLARILRLADGPGHIFREAQVIQQFGEGPLAEARALLSRLEGEGE